jgi:lipid-binding SYLF domain-containing protein
MKRTCCLVIALSLAFPVFAVDQSKERKRLEACGQVLKEILDIPDGIPKELLNKAECVIVIPSVLKFAIGIGGDYGRCGWAKGPCGCGRYGHRHEGRSPELFPIARVVCGNFT